jgi:hypothetical protein
MTTKETIHFELMNNLKNYFKNTPKEEIDKEIKRISEMECEDELSAKEYFKRLGISNYE